MTTVDSVLTKLIDTLRRLKETAEGFRSSRRNRLAQQAGRNNYQDALELRALPISDLPGRTWNRYNHCKHWQEKFDNWGGHTNGYAEYMHREAKNAYYDAYLDLLNLSETATAQLTLQPLLSIYGDSTGTVNYKVTEKDGYERNETVSDKLHRSITASVSVAAQVFAANINASVSGTVSRDIETTTSITNTKSKEVTHEWNLDIEKPKFIYQRKYDIRVGDGSQFAAYQPDLIQTPVPLLPDQIARLQSIQSRL